MPVVVTSFGLTTVNRRFLLVLILGSFLQPLHLAIAQYDPNREVGVQVSAKGITRYSPGHWGLVELRVMNRGETDAAPVSVSWLNKEKNLKFSRQLHVPPGTIRTSWYPIFIPKDVENRGTPDRMPTVELQSNTRVVEDGEEKLKRGDSHDRVEELTLRMFGAQRCVAFVSDSTPRQSEIVSLLTVLFQTIPQETLVEITDPILPASAEGYDVADVLIVAGDRVAEDEGSLSALMDWVLGGGTVWIMLDQVSPTTVSQIAGNLFSVDAVDHVTVTELAIDSEIRRTPGKPDLIRLERPVDFLRVITNGAEVTHRLEGWPAAFSRQVGAGRIVCTTVGVEGWYVPDDWAMQEELPRDTQSHRMTPVFTELLTNVILEEIEPAVPQAAQQEFVNSHIGIEIPGRKLILMLLGGFFVLLVATAFVLRRLNRIEAAGLLIPALTIGAVVCLSTVGMAYRSESDRMAQFQFLSIEPGQPLAHAEGIVATYSTAGLPGPFPVPDGGRFLPDRTGTGLGVWRRDQQDPPAWSFHLAQIPAGVRLAPFQRSLRIDGDVSVEGTFDSKGFVGTAKTGQFGQIEDVTIAGRTHFTASPDISESGDFTVRESDTLPPGEFLGGKVLNDEQQRRQTVLQKTLTIEGRDVWYPQRLTMLGWTEPVDPGIGLPLEKRTGSALLSLPVVLRRPPNDTAMRIPSLFVQMQAIRGDKGKGYSSAYNNTKGIWNDKSSKGSSTIRFQIPPELFPLDVTSATFQINISAPQRKINLSAGPPGHRVEFDSRDSMVGEFSFTLTDPETLALDEKGGLQIVLDVGEVTVDQTEIEGAAARDKSWKVHSMLMQIEATTISQEE